VVIETTGVAERVPMVWSLERPPIADRLRLAAVVTLVDPTSFAAARAASSTAEIQVESADVVLLSKLDVATADEAATARTAVAALAPQAPVVEGSAAEQVAWLEGMLLPDPQLPAKKKESGHGHGHGHEDRHGVQAVALGIGERLMDLEVLEDALAELPADYVRVKGIVRAADPRTGDATPRWAAIHRVGLRVSSEPVSPPSAGGRIVAIGPGVTEAALAACLARAVLTS
jgi:G3E family GTPase